MSEVYPSDNELLGMERDVETGVEYISTGQSPYYLHFRRMLYRLLKSFRLSNELRVYCEGGLSIGVKAGSFWNGRTLVSYGGCSGSLLSDDKSSIYVYLDGDGVLVTDEYSGFPSMVESGHLRLAIIGTSGGEVVSFEDVRGGHNYSLPFGAGGIFRTVEAHTEDDFLELCESGSVHTNEGATGVVTLSLPGYSNVGMEYTFSVVAGVELRVNPQVGVIYDSSGQVEGKHKSSSSIGSTMTVVSIGSGNWAVVSKSGTWVEEV